MKIPGIERDEDGTIVIEISEAMRLIILTAALLFVAIAIWWVAIHKAESEKMKISRVPGDIPMAEDFVDDAEPILTLPEKILGVDGPQSNLNIERLAKADRDELEKIFTGVLHDGIPRLNTEEIQLYNGLVSRSAEIAPNRSLNFYHMFEAPSQRTYTIAQLYKKWMTLDAEEAVKVAGERIEEPLLYHILKRDLPALTETQPEKALAAAKMTRGSYFRAVSVDYIRPVMRVWGKRAFSDAFKAAKELAAADGRLEAMQGLALAKLDTVTEWREAYKWASDLANSQDRLWAQVVLVEMGIHQQREGMGESVTNFSNQILKQHFLRLQEAHRVTASFPEATRKEQALYFYRSIYPYEYHGRQCVVNTFPDFEERYDAAVRLRSRWPDLRKITYVEDGYLLTSGVPASVPEAKLVPLLVRGEEALQRGDLKRAASDFIDYLHYNPGFPEIDPLMTRLSQANGTWLGPSASKLDEVILPATSYPPQSFFGDVVTKFQKLFSDVSGQGINIFGFVGISGDPFEGIELHGSFADVSARQALDTLMGSSYLPYEYKEYGLVAYYMRDEDVAPLMGRPIELIPYPVY